MDGGVTRSLYLGHNKTEEVLKRREAVEKELQAKREAKIREQYERLERAAQLKEAELRERAQQKHLRELQRQKAVLDRRCAQMEQQNARKTELLKRTHQSSSRIASLNQPKKPVYAFGSSTPRNLAFLENPQQRNNGPKNSPTGMRGSTPILPQGTSNLVPSTSRFHNPSNEKVSPEMTRSVFGALGNAIGSTPNRQLTVKKLPVHPTKQTPNAIKKQRKLATEGVSKTDGKILKNASMTQSLYTQGTSRMAMARNKQNTANPQKAHMAKQTPSKKLPPPAKVNPMTNISLGTKGAPIVHRNKAVPEQRPPSVIRPKKAELPPIETNLVKEDVTVLVKENETFLVEKNETFLVEKDETFLVEKDETFLVEKDETFLVANTVETLIPEMLKQDDVTFVAPDQDKDQIEQVVCESNQEEKDDSAIPADGSAEQTMVDMKEGEEAVNFVEQTLVAVRDEGPVPSVMVHSFMENTSGNKSGSSLFDELMEKGTQHGATGGEQFDATDHQLEKHNSHSNDVTLSCNSTSFYTALENSSTDEVSLIEHVPMSESEPIITSPKSPPKQLISDQKENQERRRQVQELIARSRQNATGSSVVTSNGTSNMNIGGFTQPSLPITASNPLLPQRDASALVQDINAKFRHKFLKQQQKDGEVTATSQDNLPTAGQLSSNPARQLAGNDNAQKDVFCLPGQVMSAANQFSHTTSLTIFSKTAEESDGHIILKQHPSPPDDPMTNGHEMNGKEFHPPEPTTKTQMS